MSEQGFTTVNLDIVRILQSNVYLLQQQPLSAEYSQMRSIFLNFLVYDDAAWLDNADVGQSRPSGRGFALILFEQLLYRVGILLFLRLRRLILHRCSLVCRHRVRTRVFRLMNSVRR